MALQCKVNFKTDRKIFSLEKLRSEIAKIKGEEPSLRIVLATGVFDLVHLGHIDYFEKAKSFGDILVVSMVDDKFVRKGSNRPVFGQDLRLKWLAALETVNYVVLNGDYGPHKTMKAIKPDIYVKGYNLTKGLMKDIVTMRDLSGQTVLIPEIMHSTEIFKRVAKLTKLKQ